MSALFPKNYSNINSNIPFNKNDIVEDIKEKLPEPWVWYTIKSHMADLTDLSVNQPYDLLIIRNKDVKEEISHERPFSSFINTVDCIYSIVLGINVVEQFSSKKVFDTSLQVTLVTAAVEVNSASALLDLIRQVDSKHGVIKNVR